jgi:hypothetical protein
MCSPLREIQNFADGAPHDVKRRLCYGVLNFQSVMHLTQYTRKRNLIYAHPFAHFHENHIQQHCAQLSYTEFHQNRTVKVKSKARNWFMPLRKRD